MSAPLFRWTFGADLLLVSPAEGGLSVDLACPACRSFWHVVQAERGERPDRPRFVDFCPGCEARLLDRVADRTLGEIRDLLRAAAKMIREGITPDERDLARRYSDRLSQMGREDPAYLLDQLVKPPTVIP